MFQCHYKSFLLIYNDIGFYVYVFVVENEVQVDDFLFVYEKSILWNKNYVGV